MSSPPTKIARECVEAYLYATPPLELLLFRRPPERGRFWVPVSGKVDPGDRDFEAALLREIDEETGLRPAAPPEPLDWHVPFPAENGETWRLHAYAVRVARDARPVLSREHDASEWVTTSEAIRRLHFPDNAEAVRRLAARLDPGPRKA